MILWDHGGGPLGGVCYDELYGSDSLTITDLIAAMQNSPFAEAPLEWIGFDACLMASVENASALAPFARYLIASENTEPADGWNYSFLKDIEQDADGGATGQRIVDSYFNTDAADERTLSCIDLSMMDEVATAMDVFFSRQSVDNSNYAMYAYGVRNSTAFGRASSDTTALDLVDLGSLLRLLFTQEPQAARQLETALQHAVICQRSNIPGTTGMTVYHPCYNRSAFLNRWGGEYQLNSPFQSYIDYTMHFASYLFGEASLSWDNLAASVTLDGKNFVLPLSEQQLSNLAAASMHVLQWHGENKTYSPLCDAEIIVSEHELISSFAGKFLVLKGTETVIPYTLRDDGSLLIYVNYMNGPTDLTIPEGAARFNPFDAPVAVTQTGTSSYQGASTAGSTEGMSSKSDDIATVSVDTASISQSGIKGKTVTVIAP